MNTEKNTQNMMDALQTFNGVFNTPENINLFNSVIQDPYNNLICVQGTDCYKQKTAKDLEQKLLQAKTNVQKAPRELNQAEKDYYTFTLGKSGYRQKLEKDVQEKVDQEVQQMQNEYQKIVSEAIELNDELQQLKENEANLTDLYETYLKKNKYVTKEVRQIDADIVTNDRKTYYENQKWNQLLFWNRILFYLYAFAAVVVVFYIMFYGTYTWDKKAFFMVLIVAFPFLIRRLLVLLIRLFIDFTHWLPKNVYF